MNVADQITAKLTAAFHPFLLTVEDESHLHHVPAGAQSHFKVVLISDQFSGERPVRRHQRVYQALHEELTSGVHALALHTLTEAEWQQRGEAAFASTRCHGG